MSAIYTNAVLKERNASESERLLPIEKRMIGWSLTVGVTLLGLLWVVNHFLPLS